MRPFIHVTIDNSQSYNRPALNKVLGPEGTWIEYAPGCFLLDIEPKKSVSEVTNQILRTLGDEVEAMIFEAELDVSGVSRYPQRVHDFVRARANASEAAA